MLASNVQNGELVVPAGNYFAMGDNRENSLDSRYWGFVPRENIIGKPLVIFWSYDAPTEEWAGDSGSHYRRSGQELFHQDALEPHAEAGARNSDPVVMSHNYGLILAGGRGTRFWPRSRRAAAKQVLKFFGDRTLIQQTVDRLRPVLPPERIWILTNDHLRAEIVKQLPEVPKRQILAEPAQRNTAPAIGLAAHILQSLDPDALMGVFPADHVIAKPREYVRLLQPAFQSAAQGNIVVLGIQPRWAETGYGYIEFPEGVQPGGRSAHARRKLPRKARRRRRPSNF